MWSHVHGGNIVKTVSRQTVQASDRSKLIGAEFFCRTIISNSGTSSNSNVVLRHSVEDVRKIQGRYTLSFYAKSDSPKNMAFEFSQVFGTGGSAIAYITPEKVQLSTEWQRYSVIIDVPDITDKTIGQNSYCQLMFWFSGGSDFNLRTGNLGLQTGTFDIAQAKFERGDKMTAFEIPDPVVELLRVSRYYEQIARSSNFITSFHLTFNGYMGIIPIARKRIAPAVTISPITAFFLYPIETAATAITVTPREENLIVFIRGISPTGYGDSRIGGMYPQAFIAVDARL